ncbi:type II secretion system secretin GspD [Oharaeibacter diazotrophicus]|uniref:type II secretion system secretin GspD n=2 Tax=Oharaeibacter diazotrophicus TaxID=1920512 RepID=UPI001414DD94|nr:type II secretion system secretin GspD [Oharaeibacter diazotrophicus]
MRLLLVIVGLAGVVSCASLDSEPDSRGSVFEGGVFGDLRARKPKPSAREPQGLIPVGGGGSGRSQIFGPGAYAADGTAAAGARTGAATDPAAGEATGASQPDAYRLNFDNAEIRDVVHAVLGEALGLNYTISPDVAGTTSISSARPVSRNELLSTLETVLSSQGFSLTKSGGVYRVGPLLPAAGAVDVGRRSSPGYGVSIVPLRFVSVQAISRLLGGFVTDAESLRIDRTKNALVISGPGPKREEVVQTVLSFDEDWMANQSVAILELKRAQPDAIVSELERVFDSGANGNANGAIQFKPIKRLRAVLAVSSNQTLIRRAETWVRRLDQENADGEGNVFIYRAKYRDSKELAKIVGTLFGISADTSLSTGGQQGTSGGGSGTSGSGSTTGSPISGSSTAGGTDPTQSTDPSQTGETPIDNVTGAGEDSGGGDQSGTSASDSASPDVIDLTRQGNEGANTAVRISADPTNNSVVVFADGDTFRKIQATLRELDVPPLQVAIQATIAEVKLNTTLQYGVKYYFQSGDAGVNFQNSEASTLTRTLPGFNFLLGAASDPDMIISALDKVTDVEILSSPSLVVMENQTANLQVGNSVPIQVSQRTSNDTSNAVTVNEIEYRNTGIILKVTPRIGDNGAVTMSIDQEISNVADQSNKLGPTFSQRKVSSRISVVSGQTVVLAGLITSSKDNGRTGLPLVNRIPILRDAAGDTSKKGERTELVVLIKPVVIHDGEDAQTVAEDLRSRLWSIGQRERQSP